MNVWCVRVCVCVTETVPVLHPEETIIEQLQAIDVLNTYRLLAYIGIDPLTLRRAYPLWSFAGRCRLLAGRAARPELLVALL